MLNTNCLNLIEIKKENFLIYIKECVLLAVISIAK